MTSTIPNDGSFMERFAALQQQQAGKAVPDAAEPAPAQASGQEVQSASQPANEPVAAAGAQSPATSGPENQAGQPSTSSGPGGDSGTAGIVPTATPQQAAAATPKAKPVVLVKSASIAKVQPRKLPGVQSDGLKKRKLGEWGARIARHAMVFHQAHRRRLPASGFAIPSRHVAAACAACCTAAKLGCRHSCMHLSSPAAASCICVHVPTPGGPPDDKAMNKPAYLAEMDRYKWVGRWSAGATACARLPAACSPMAGSLWAPWRHRCWHWRANWHHGNAAAASSCPCRAQSCGSDTKHDRPLVK